MLLVYIEFGSIVSIVILVAIIPNPGGMTQDKVRNIIDEALKAFVVSDAFLQAIQKAVRESVQADCPKSSCELKSMKPK